MIRKLFFSTLVGLLISTPAWAADADHIQVDTPYARAVPPGAPASAAFMTLTNTGSQATALMAARSDISEVTELHTHIHDNGVMRMRPIERIDLPAGQTVHLQPGGLHIMLINLKKPLKAGETVHLTLIFKDGSRRVISLPVRALNAPMMKHHHGQQHQEHDHAHKHDHVHSMSGNAHTSSDHSDAGHHHP